MSDIKEEDFKVMEACYLCGKLCAPKGLKAHIRSHTNITIFDCSECGHRFSTKKLLQQHKITHSTHYLCEECNGKYKDTEHLKSHKCIPLMEQRECQYCGKFCAPKGLFPHIRSHKNCKKYVCDECGEKFSSKKIMKKHELSHKVYLYCDDCNGRFRDPERFKTHHCIYGKEKNQFCDICGKAFFTKYDLNRHQIIHTDKKPFKCDICRKGFNQKSNRDSHYRTHRQGNQENTKEKKFVCEICFRAFGYRQHLKRHILIHTNEKPYACEICKKSFSQKSYLKLHAAVHTNERPFECEKCQRRFPCKWKLVQHQRRHEEPRIFCTYCGKGFYMPSEYDRHIMTHTKAKPYICDVCHKGFTARFSLQSHYQLHVKQAKKKNKVLHNDIKVNFKDNEGEVQEIFYDSELYNEILENDDEVFENDMLYEVEESNEDFENEISYDNFEDDTNYEGIINENIDQEILSNPVSDSIDEVDPYTKYLSEIDFSNFSNPEGDYVEVEIPMHLIDQENFLDPENFSIQNDTFDDVPGAVIIKLDKKPFPCHVCKRIFVDEKNLENHQRKFIKENNFVCCACGKKSDSENDFLAHQKVHEISSKKPHVSFLTREL